MSSRAGFLAAVIAMCISAAAERPTAQSTITAPPPGSARVVLSIDQSRFFLGENVLLHYCVENTSSTPFQISYGGDSRGASRSLRFKVTVTDAVVLAAITIVGCSMDNGGDAATAPTPAPAVTTTIPANSVPEISHLTANFTTNTCTRAADHLQAMALVVTFDYVDGAGDLTGGRVQINRVYNTGRSESHVSPIPSEATLSGTPTTGLLTISNACPLYDNATSSTEMLTLFDAGGRASNSLSITVNRPPGDR